MSTVVGKSQFTPEDLLRMPDEARFELVDGQLVECEMSFESGWVTSLLAGILSAYALKHQSGGVSTEATFQCFADDPNRIRRPDIPFDQKSRLRTEMLTGHVQIGTRFSGGSRVAQRLVLRGSSKGRRIRPGRCPTYLGCQSSQG